MLYRGDMLMSQQLHLPPLKGWTCTAPVDICASELVMPGLWTLEAGTPHKCAVSWEMAKTRTAVTAPCEESSRPVLWAPLIRTEIEGDIHQRRE